MQNAKQYAGGMPFPVLSWHPELGRVKAQIAYLSAAGQGAAIGLETDRGTYELWDQQTVRLTDGSVIQAAQLKPGQELSCCVINNVDGFITVETAGKSIPIAQLLEADMDGTDLAVESFQASSKEIVQTVKRIKPIGAVDLYRIEIDCSSPDTASADSTANFVAWSDGTSFGSGIFAY